jgi:hypothetical protein
MNDRGLLDRIVSHLGLGIALAFVLVTGTASAQPFDITDTTMRSVLIDIEGSADPLIVGTDAAATFPGGFTNQLTWVWSSDGTTGTISIAVSDLEALLVALGVPVDPPGNWTSSVTIDIATGEGEFTAFGTGDFNGVPPLDTLDLGFRSGGGPYPPLGVPGNQAGYEEDSLAPGALLFCTDLVSFAGPGGCGASTDGGNQTFGRPFGLVPDYAYIPASGLINMTGMSFPSTSSAPTFSEGGDWMLTELPEPDGLAMLTSGIALLFFLRRQRRSA